MCRLKADSFRIQASVPRHVQIMNHPLPGQDSSICPGPGLFPRVTQFADDFFAVLFSVINETGNQRPE